MFSDVAGLASQQRESQPTTVAGLMMPSVEMEAEVAGVGSRPERQEGPRQALEPSTTCSWLGGEPGQMTGGFPHQLCKQSAQKEGFGLGSRKLNTVKKALESQSVDWHCTACILVASLQCQAQRWHRLSASRDFSRTTGSTRERWPRTATFSGGI